MAEIYKPHNPTVPVSRKLYINNGVTLVEAKLNT